MRSTLRSGAILAIALFASAACGGAGGGGGSPGPGNPSVELKEWEVRVNPTTLTAGTVTIAVKNTGSSAHDLTVIKTDKAPDQLANDGSRVTEASLGVSTAINPGQTGALSVNLSPGSYVFICNQPGHYPLGMRTAVTVR